MSAKPGIEVGRDHLTDLVYADDTAFLLKSTADAITSLSSLSEMACNTQSQNFLAKNHA